MQPSPGVDPASIPVSEPDFALEPDGFVVVVESGDRIHFLDWGGPAVGGAGIVAVHGLSQTGWAWAPVARRLAGTAGTRRVVTMDLRGHGLSDAPTDDGAYDLAVLASDVVAVAEGSGVLVPGDHGPGVVLAGHGFGAIVAANAAVDLGDRCAGLVLVDGGWESMEASTGIDVDEFLRGIDEPPEVMRSLTAYLRDRARFDPETWDDDQDRAARATVVETHAGRVVPATRPHALEASVRAMFTYDPVATLPAVAAPVVALVAGDDDSGSRASALRSISAARVGAGGTPIQTLSFGHDGHNLMRYRAREVAGAIASVGARRT
ncbi:MAG TPA: alpha/beta hydrolase [Methylomirabilota bacterium]|nr:alpha/beta hydrolase [Methylomirabilota bacterium]